MKAILVGENRELRWSEVPDPCVGPEEVLVKIEAAALNRADLMQREGDYPPPAGCPEWMGLEIAGTVQKSGGSVRLEDRRQGVRTVGGRRLCGICQREV